MKDNFMDWILKIQYPHRHRWVRCQVSFFSTTGKFLYLITAQSVERLTYTVSCTVHSDLKITEKWRYFICPANGWIFAWLGWPRKMAVPSPIGDWTVSSISTFVLMTLTLKNVLFTTYIRKQAHTSRFLSLSATAFAIRSSSSSTSCCLWLASFFLIRCVCSWKALKKRETVFWEQCSRCDNIYRAEYLNKTLNRNQSESSLKNV